MNRLCKWFMVGLVGTSLLSGNVLAFKLDIHKEITEEVLSAPEFDGHLAYKVGESNAKTDIYDPSVDAAHADNNMLGDARNRLDQKIGEIITALKECRHQDALDALGTALHTVQDIYAHSNHVDNGWPITWSGDELPSELKNGTADCYDDSNFSPPPDGGLVSGYFSLTGYLSHWLKADGQCTGIEDEGPPHMCCHYYLNKDDNEEHTPNRRNYSAAENAAKEATKSYLQLIEKRIRQKFPEEANDFINRLHEEQSTRVFLVDTSGSMSPYISEVKNLINDYLNNKEKAGSTSPRVGLVTFNDEGFEHSEISCNIPKFKKIVESALASAHGGGDCPEDFAGAIEKGFNMLDKAAVDKQLLRGHEDIIILNDNLGLYLISDAPVTREEDIPTDGKLHGMPIPISIGRVGGKTCHTTTSPERRSRSAKESQTPSLAEQTGGISFDVTKDEISQITPLLLALDEPDATTFFSKPVYLSSGNPLNLTIPIDDTFSEQVTFMLTNYSDSVLSNFTLQRPDGTQVQADDPNVKSLNLSSLISYMVDHPMIGNWQVLLEGEGNFNLKAFGESALRINDIKMLSKTDKVLTREPEELAPIAGHLVAGMEIVMEIHLTTSLNTATPPTLQLLRPDGSLITTLELTVKENSNQSWRATFIVPAEPFIISVKGFTSGGTEFTRNIAQSIIPQSVKVNIAPQLRESAPGMTVSFQVKVTNVSAQEATYNLTATDKLNWSVDLPSPEITVAAHSAEIITAKVKIPLAATEDETNTIIILARDSKDSSIENSNFVFLKVGDGKKPYSVEGYITDQLGQLFPNVLVEIEGFMAVTDANGYYHIPGLAAGTYLLKATADGQNFISKEVTTGDNAPELVNFVLETVDEENHTLTINKQGNGTITDDQGKINCGTMCTADYPPNTIVTLTATPAAGSDFTSWQDACSGTELTTKVTLDNSKACTAIFFNPLAVTLSHSTLTPLANGFRLNWQTGYEDNCAGFQVWRAWVADGPCWNKDVDEYQDITQVTEQLLTAKGEGSSYTFDDLNINPAAPWLAASGNADTTAKGKPGYCYGLEEVHFDGSSSFYLLDPDWEGWVPLTD